MNRPRILVVDDTPRNVKLLADLLEAAGCDVVTASGGSEALAACRDDTAGRPDLVLLDVVMPGMDGYAVCRALRADPATATLPVVMVTALDATTERVQGLDAAQPRLCRVGACELSAHGVGRVFCWARVCARR